MTNKLKKEFLEKYGGNIIGYLTQPVGEKAKEIADYWLSKLASQREEIRRKLEAAKVQVYELSDDDFNSGLDTALSILQEMEELK